MTRLEHGTSRWEVPKEWYQPDFLSPSWPAPCPRSSDVATRGLPARRREQSPVAEDWGEQFRKALDQLATIATIKASEARRMEQFERGLAAVQDATGKLERRIAELEDLPEPIMVPISTFAPEPFDVIQPLLVVVEPIVGEPDDDCEYVATFVDAEIAASGDTVTEAVLCLKDRLLATFDMLDRMPKTRLGKRPKRQLAVLQSVIRRAV